MRLDKYFSSQGIKSRKEIAVFIKKGLVKVNGVVAKKGDTKVDPDVDVITLEGEPVGYKEHLYVMLYKPKGVVSATEDRINPTVVSILPSEYQRRGIFPAGRLDKDTTGFVLMTTNGDFAHRILSPNNHVRKTYVAVVDGIVTKQEIKLFSKGITLADGLECKPAILDILNAVDIPKDSTRYMGEINSGNSLVQITITEGKYHQVRRMFASIGKPVLELKRIMIGGLSLCSGLGMGECKELDQVQIDSIYEE